mmetsp:Transcript_16243/g.46359  ORF Transcript_16243/g.46359 Transcript_16243/m.46359 type:complete len:251 (+) Transcript_16243:3465-4217(+)
MASSTASWLAFLVRSTCAALCWLRVSGRGASAAAAAGATAALAAEQRRALLRDWRPLAQGRTPLAQGRALGGRRPRGCRALQLRGLRCLAAAEPQRLLEGQRRLHSGHLALLADDVGDPARQPPGGPRRRRLPRLAHRALERLRLKAVPQVVRLDVPGEGRPITDADRVLLGAAPHLVRLPRQALQVLRRGGVRRGRPLHPRGVEARALPQVPLPVEVLLPVPLPAEVQVPVVLLIDEHPVGEVGRWPQE